MTHHHQVNDMVQVSFDWGPKEQYNGPGRVLALPSPDMPFYRIRVVEADGTAYDWSLRESEIRPLVAALEEEINNSTQQMADEAMQGLVWASMQRQNPNPPSQHHTGPGATAAYFDKKHDQGKRDWTLLPVKGLYTAIAEARENDDMAPFNFTTIAECLVAWRDSGERGWLLEGVAIILKGIGVHTALDGVMQVLEFGAKKYAKDSWRTVPNAVDRYYSAAWRHLERMGDLLKDDESSLPHEYHLLCNLLFLLDLSA